MYSIFFEKFPENFLIFFYFFQIEKNYHFVPKLVQNHNIDQNLANFPLKTADYL